jgi:predicted DNA binding CopG/RHH family protein
MVRKKTKLPTFHNDQEERAFWSRHSVEEFAGALEDLDIVIQPTRTEQIALRLTKEDVETLRAIAKRKGVGHTTLVRSVVEQWVAQVRQKTKQTRSARQHRAA